VAGRSIDPADIGARTVLRLALTPVTRGKFEGEDLDLRQWNMTIKEISKFADPVLHFLHPAGGVFIQGIRSPGNAADADLRRQDIILEIDRRPTRTLRDVKTVYDRLVEDEQRAEKKVLIKIKRGGFVDWKTLDWHKDYLKED
jgi:S1-C subfamily serine protease